MRAALRWAIAAMVAGFSAPAFADQWDDLARRLVAEKGASLVNRFDVKGEATILMEQKGLDGTLSLVVADSNADLSFQLTSNAKPADGVFAQMADTATVVVGAAAATIQAALRQCYDAVSRDASGFATAGQQSLEVSCILVPGGRLTFIVSGG